MTMSKCEIEAFIDERMEPHKAGVTIPFDENDGDVYDWLRDRREQSIFGKYYVSPRGRDVYVGVRRLSRYE